MEPYRLHASLGYRLSLAARLQERRLEAGLKRLGLTRTNWCALLAVGVEGLTQPSEIAEFIGIDRTATSRALRQMEADGMIAREGGEADRRTTTVSLTEKGHRLLARGIPFAEANNAAMAVKLQPGEERELRRLLARLVEGEDAALPQF